MKKILLSAMTVLLPVAGVHAQSEAPAAETAISRIDCGRSDGPRDISAFSDTHAYDGEKIPLVASCYLIRHGDALLLWDAGYPAEAAEGKTDGLVMDATIIDQLAEGDLSPQDIDYLGISHYHGDHIGQAKFFPQAKLLIGNGDWEALRDAAANGAEARMGAPDPAPLDHWIAGDGDALAVEGDHDVFGDGSVVMLDAPGHTPGHNALLVRLTGGAVMLTGDAAHFTRNYENDGVPGFNTDRADTLASLDRFKRMADNLGALVVIQHEPGDVGKLPAFPDMRR